MSVKKEEKVNKEQKDVAAEQSSAHIAGVAQSMQKELKGSPGDVSVIRLVSNLIENAVELRASDIHIDPSEKEIRVRFRIDGVLHENFTFPKELQSEIITRIKVLAGLRTDEHQAAQDGRIRFVLSHDGGSNIDIRVSIAPTFYGENCVMRLLGENAQTFSLETLGFSPVNFDRIMRAIKRPYGMILATGPTGSGKTTTLYAILKKLNSKEISIITIEDPVEYSMEGIDQVQVNARTNLTFAQGLRFILRQDPNIIMVGEIRDNETAGISVNAAMTGHLVLTTLHTNDSSTTLPRLLDMGVEPFLISSTINIAIGQRLVRMICPDCKVQRRLTEAELKALQASISSDLLKNQTDFFMGVGCKKCDGSGYRSRIGIHEVLEMNDEIRQLIMHHSDASDVRKAAIKGGMVPMLEDGIQKAIQGVTTIEEVLRVFHD